MEKPQTWIDTTPYQGKNYWPRGPFPVILLLPFVFVFNLFGLFFRQAYLQPFLTAGVFYLVYRISKKVGYTSIDSYFWAFAFCFSTVFIDVALWPEVWGFAHVTATFLIFLIISLHIKRASHWLVGILLGLAVATRFPTLGLCTFFFFEIIYGKLKLREKIVSLLKLSIPILLALFLVGLYNYIRFESFLDAGYSHQILTNSNLEKARGYGVMSPIHIPGNLYHFLLATPLPIFRDDLSHVLEFPYLRADPWGMGLFIISPIFIYLFFLKYKDRLSKEIFLTCLLIALPIFLYYGIG